MQRRGHKHHTRFFLVFVARSEGLGDRARLPATRLGVTVTRKVGKAVQRNRIKRLVREAFRRQRSMLPSGLDMVWVAKRDATDMTYDGVVADLQTLAGRLRHRSRSR